MHKRKCLLALLLFATLAACDPAVEYNQIVENQSSHTLYIVPADTGGICRNLEGKDSLVIAAETEDTLVDYWQIGRVGDFEDYPYRSDSVRVRIEGDSLELKVSIENPGNWLYQLIDEGAFGSGSCECRLLITDEQLE